MVWFLVALTLVIGISLGIPLGMWLARILLDKLITQGDQK